MSGDGAKHVPSEILFGFEQVNKAPDDSVPATWM